MTKKAEVIDEVSIQLEGAGRIKIGDRVDHLVTTTYTNTQWFTERSSWKCRQASITIDVKKAKKLIELLQKYVEYKEDKE